MAGYHNKSIKRGQFGEFSKIQEEFQELEDAIEQDAKIMALCEIADLYGAIEAFITKHYNMTMDDVIKMNELTKQAFNDGTRVSKSN